MMILQKKMMEVFIREKETKIEEYLLIFQLKTVLDISIKENIMKYKSNQYKKKLII